DGIRDRNVTGVQTCALPIYDLAFECGGLLLHLLVGAGKPVGLDGSLLRRTLLFVGRAAQLTQALIQGVRLFLYLVDRLDVLVAQPLQISNQFVDRAVVLEQIAGLYRVVHLSHDNVSLLVFVISWPRFSCMRGPGKIPAPSCPGRPSSWTSKRAA